MKKLEKLKKNYVINTAFLDKKDFNELVYIIDANKESVKVFVTTKTGKVSTKEIEIKDEFCEKTFITIKDFFKKCTKDNTEYKIENVENGDIYLRVAYFNDLSLFYKITYKTHKTNFVLTNINKYKFYKTNNNIQRALDRTNFSFIEKEQLVRYLSSLKNIKRDFIFSIKKSKENLEKNLNKD